MDNDRLLLILTTFKTSLARLLRDLEAGMSASVAFEVALRDLDREYHKVTLLEGIQAINPNLDPVSVELHARFALDCLFGSLKGAPDESEARKAFWQCFRRATRPSLTPVNPS